MNILITAGPTQEPIDPVRVITNRSTGLMGVEIAKRAAIRKHKVTLISGPVSIALPKMHKLVRVKTAEEMLKAVLKNYRNNDCLIMTAAVADYKAAVKSKKKLKKGGKKKLSIQLSRNKDILGSLKNYKKMIKVGFCLETNRLLDSARKKLKEKKLDFIVANVCSKRHNPFGSGKKNYSILTKESSLLQYRKKSKTELAKLILNIIEDAGDRVKSK